MLPIDTADVITGKRDASCFEEDVCSTPSGRVGALAAVGVNRYAMTRIAQRRDAEQLLAILCRFERGSTDTI